MATSDQSICALGHPRCWWLEVGLPEAGTLQGGKVESGWAAMDALLLLNEAVGLLNLPHKCIGTYIHWRCMQRLPSSSQETDPKLQCSLALARWSSIRELWSTEAMGVLAGASVDFILRSLSWHRCHIIRFAESCLSSSSQTLVFPFLFGNAHEVSETDSSSSSFAAKPSWHPGWRVQIARLALDTGASMKKQVLRHGIVAEIHELEVFRVSTFSWTSCADGLVMVTLTLATGAKSRDGLAAQHLDRAGDVDGRSRGRHGADDGIIWFECYEPNGI